MRRENVVGLCAVIIPANTCLY